MNRGHSTIKTSEVVSYFAEQRVREYNLDFGSGAMVIKLDDGTEQKYTVPAIQVFLDEIKPYVDEYNEAHPDSPLVYNWDRPQETPWILSLLSLIHI